MTNKERRDKQNYRARLLREFPNGVAEVRPIKERRGPKSIMMDDPTEEQMYRVKATGVEFRVMKESGGTHPITGISMSIPQVIEMYIHPIPGRTDRFPQGKPWFKKPIEVLEYLADRDHGWGKTYRLVPVPSEVIDIEESAMEDPESRRLFERVQSQYSLKTNEDILGVDTAMLKRMNGHPEKLEVIEEDYEEPSDDDDPEEIRAREIERELA